MQERNPHKSIINITEISKYKNIPEAIKAITLVIFLLLEISSGYSQRLHFNTLSIYDGMSQNMINCILQDHQGFMWFGTKDGLNRYDGYSFKIYKANLYDSTSIGDNHISYLYEDDLHHLWISTQLGGLFLFDRTRNAFINYNQGDLQAGIDQIVSITGNSKTGIWLSTLDGNIFKLSIQNPQADQLPKVNIVKVLDKTSIGAPRAESIRMDSRRTLWILTGKGLCFYNIDQKKISRPAEKFKIYRFDKASRSKVSISTEYSPFHQFMMSSYIDDDGFLWLSGERGVYRFDQHSNEFLLYEIDGWVKTFTISKDLSGDKEIWAGAYYKGLNIVNTTSGEVRNIKTWELTKLEDRDQVITQVFRGKDGNIWFGTNGNGLARYSPYTSLFSNNIPDKVNGKRIDSRSLYSIFPLSKEKDGDILLSSLHYFLHYSTKSRSLLDSSFFVRVARGDDDGVVWMGSTLGLLRYLPQKYSYDIVDPDAKDIRGIHIDKQRVWYLLPKALYCYNMATGEKQSFPLPGAIAISGYYSLGSLYCTLQADEKNVLWIGTANGLAKFDMSSQKIVHIYKNNPKNRRSINSNEIKCILPDPGHPETTLWVGTTSGLNKLDKKSGLFRHYGIKEGLPNNTVYGILSDKQGDLWISTNQGIAVFNPLTEEVTTFDYSNGLQSNEFNTGAYFKSSWGEMFFGGINGYNRFYPEQIKVAKNNTPIVISDIQLLYNGKQQSLFNNLARNLKYSENNITITLASLDFTATQKLKYAYRIYNRDTSWIQLGTNRVVALSNLSPGEYIFQAKGTDSFGRWSKKYVQFVFIISPPWWNTILARLIYLLLSATIAFFLWRYNKQRLIQKHQAEEDKRKAAAIVELDIAKSRFLTNISHEFRTPLTLILGLTEPSSNRISDEDTVVKNNQTIHRNGRQLLTLVDQILELAKLESGKLSLDERPGNLKDFITHLVYSFESLAQLNGVSLTFHPSFTNYHYVYDSDKLQQIVTNLISNAVKFNQSGGQVEVKATIEHTPETDNFIFSVKDTGIGIETDEIATIFDRFHRAKSIDSRQLPGTGIGLALVKELAELMMGSIRVSSQKNIGSFFEVTIPMKPCSDYTLDSSTDKGTSILPHALQSKGLAPYRDEEEDNAIEAEEDKMRVLVVEDNHDVRSYILSCLGERFNTIPAIDGSDGLRKAIHYMPDIIISDVMMPEMDGFEMCDALKSNSLTNHIPIILLTAKVDAESRITGLKKGADAYLAKPFVKEELMVRLENMSQLISRMRSHYLSLMKEELFDSPNISEAKKQEEGAEMPGDAFLNQALELLEIHYADEEYSIELMAQSLYMSRSQLFRKIKTLTGKSPSAFLRTFRLNKAKKLLVLHPDKNISEVAYSTGFNSPKYFSNVFLEEFGHRPKEK